ncbi:hypothetical protein niasHT_017619 [Heterodera trifolii]|uniref:Uncharacterized protein n=1 Tax=Heterodera trifolii TaxID=157864 RepID=A0ABD2L0L4_9BILA
MTLYASHDTLRVPWHFTRPNNILRVPSHFTRPMAFYASQQHFTRPITFYASHDTLRVPWHFTRPNNILRVPSHFTRPNNSLRVPSFTNAIGLIYDEVAIENAEAENQQLSLSRMQSVNGSFEKIGDEPNEFEAIGVADVLSSVDHMQFGQQNPAQFDNPSAKKTKSYAEAVRVELADGGNSDEPMMEWEVQQNQREDSAHGDSTLSDNVHCLQPVAQPVTEFGIDLVPIVSARQTGEDFGVRNVQQQDQSRRNDESDIGQLEKKEMFCVFGNSLD